MRARRSTPRERLQPGLHGTAPSIRFYRYLRRPCLYTGIPLAVYRYTPHGIPVTGIPLTVYRYHRYTGISRTGTKLHRARSRRYRSKQACKYVRSFSEKKKKNFASKYPLELGLESSRRDLHNALLCTVLVESVSKLNFLFEKSLLMLPSFA